MTNKPTTEWQTKTPASGQPSASMDCKPTTEWQMKTPTLAPQSPQIVPIPTPIWTLPSSSDKIWPSNLIEIIRAIKTILPRRPTPPDFTFDLTREAAEQNYMLLMHKHKGSLAALLESQRGSTVGYSSEFRDKATLYHLFARHPNWNRMTPILQNGSEWPLEPLDKDSRRADVDEALAFGNHKGALLQPKLLKQLVTKDVHYRYCLPLPLEKATKIPNILIAPMNIQMQDIDKGV